MGLFDWFKKKEIQVEEKQIIQPEKDSTCDVVKNIIEAENDYGKCSRNGNCKSIKEDICKEKEEYIKKNCTKEDGSVNPIIILLDDNEGILSLLEDDLYVLDDEGKINIDDYCIVKFSGILAIFDYLPFLRKNYKHIQGGIFDLTIGGVLRYNEENIRLTGMDAIYANYLKGIKRNIIFTGNTLNPNIQSNNEVLKQYEKITERNLLDDVIFKTSFDDDERRTLIYDKIFK
jgi:hypothetical protein